MNVRARFTTGVAAMICAATGCGTAARAVGSGPGADASVDGGQTMQARSADAGDAHDGTADATSAAEGATGTDAAGSDATGHDAAPSVDATGTAGSSDLDAAADATDAAAETSADGGAGDAAADAGGLARCDDGGQCACIAIASIGHEGVWGPCSSDPATGLQLWLNAVSTARVDTYDTAKPTLTADFLSQYDVLLLQWMVQNGEQDNDGPAWVFSAPEIAALETWVRAGGGLIVLSGYQCTGAGCTIVDTTAANQCLSFTDMQLNADDTFDPGNTTCADCYCWGGALPIGSPLAEGGAPTSGPWSTTSPMGAHVQDLGADIGRSIYVGSADVVVDSTDGTKVFAAHEAVGAGHVVVYGDEWITYPIGFGLPDGGPSACASGAAYTNPYGPCYARSASQIFQIPQFWYNAIGYAAASPQCFAIHDPAIVR